MKGFDKNIGVENLLGNPSFREWVLRPNSELEEHWTNWLRDNPDENNNLLKAKEIILNVENVEDRGTNTRVKIKVWEKIEKSIAKVDCEQLQGSEYKSKVVPIHPYYQHVSGPVTPKSYRKWLGIAAAIILICISAFLVLEEFSFSQQDPLANATQMVIKSNLAGQKSTIFLPDGSTVILNAESELSYSPIFDGSAREVFLKGEAFFDVVKNSAKPFIVYSGNIATTALGTAFNIRSFNDSSSIEVSLVNGKVVIADIEEEKNIVYLEPGEQLQYERKSKTLKKTHFLPLEVISWKDGVLYFKNASKKEVFERLERWYGVDFTFSGAETVKKDWNYTGSYENQNLEVVLNGLGFTQNFSFKINEKEVEIFQK